MFGAAEKKSKDSSDISKNIDFREAIQRALIDILDDNVHVQAAIEDKLDGIISSSAVMEKIFSEIESSIALNGKSFLATKTNDLLDSNDFKENIQQSVSNMLEQNLEKTGPRTLINYFGDPNTKTIIRDQVTEKVEKLFKGNELNRVIIEQATALIDKLAEQTVTKSLNENIRKEDIQTALKAEAARLVKNEVDANFPRLIRIERPDGSRSGTIKPHKQFETVLNAAQVKGANILLVGPAGSGKTKIAIDVATALGRTFYFNGPIQSEYKLLGFRDAQGQYSPTPFYNAYTEGGVYLFDEIDASSPQALVAFNTAIANGYCDFPSHDRPVEISSDFLCMAAANTYGRGANHLYVGRNQLDAATMDRFIVIDVDYDEEMEGDLAENQDWVRKVQRWRKKAEELKVRHVISMRASIMGARLLKNNITEAAVEEMVVWRGLDPSTVSKIKAM